MPKYGSLMTPIVVLRNGLKPGSAFRLYNYKYILIQNYKSRVRYIRYEVHFYLFFSLFCNLAPTKATVAIYIVYRFSKVITRLREISHDPLFSVNSIKLSNNPMHYNNFVYTHYHNLCLHTNICTSNDIYKNETGAKTNCPVKVLRQQSLPAPDVT